MEGDWLDDEPGRFTNTAGVAGKFAMRVLSITLFKGERDAFGLARTLLARRATLFTSLISHRSAYVGRVYVAPSKRLAKLCSPRLEAVLDAVNVLPESTNLVEDLSALVERGEVPAAIQFPRKVSVAARDDIEVRLRCEWVLRLRLSRHCKEFGFKMVRR